MFKFDIMKLINNYYSTSDNYKRQAINSEIRKLVKENREEAQRFLEHEAISNAAQSLIQEALTQIDEKEFKQKELEEDIGNIREGFSLWLQDFTNNNKTPTKRCAEIIEQLIDFYISNRYEVLEQIISTRDTEEFELFKNHLMNKLREYLSQRIITTKNLENFKKLPYFKRRKEQKKFINFLKEMNNYKFRIKEIREALTKWETR